jgi:hypothetical protein
MPLKSANSRHSARIKRTPIVKVAPEVMTVMRSKMIQEWEVMVKEYSVHNSENFRVLLFLRNTSKVLYPTIIDK